MDTKSKLRRALDIIVYPLIFMLMGVLIMITHAEKERNDNLSAMLDSSNFLFQQHLKEDSLYLRNKVRIQKEIHEIYRDCEFMVGDKTVGSDGMIKIIQESFHKNDSLGYTTRYLERKLKEGIITYNDLFDKYKSATDDYLQLATKYKEARSRNISDLDSIRHYKYVSEYLMKEFGVSYTVTSDSTRRIYEFKFSEGLPKKSKK